MKEGRKKQEKKMAATREGDRGKEGGRERKKKKCFYEVPHVLVLIFLYHPFLSGYRGGGASLDFDFVQLELESKELCECGRKCREADDLGDVV